VLVSVDADPDVLVDPHVVRIATSRARCLDDPAAAPRDLLRGAPVEGRTVVPRAREVQHLRPERPKVDPHTREARSQRVDRIAHRADRRGGQVSCSDTEREPTPTSLDCFLGYRYEVVH